MQILFTFAGMYDALWQDWINIFERKQHRQREVEDIQSFNKHWDQPSDIEDTVQNVRNWWGEDGRQILEEISNTSTLEWGVDHLTCYLIREGRGFSDPLTICCPKSKQDFINLCTHELIHNNLTRNGKKIQPTTTYLFQKYATENPSTIYHVLVFAIHVVIWTKLFDEKRLDALLNWQWDLQCRRAIEIVQTEGAENIIRECLLDIPRS